MIGQAPPLRGPSANWATYSARADPVGKTLRSRHHSDMANTSTETHSTLRPLDSISRTAWRADCRHCSYVSSSSSRLGTNAQSSRHCSSSYQAMVGELGWETEAWSRVRREEK